MIYMLRGAFDVMYDFLGQWWFDAEDPMELETVPALIAEAEDDEDDTPLPPATGQDRPKCVSCGDPNFSREGDNCIACRIGMC